MDTFDMIGDFLGIQKDSSAYQSLKANYVSMASQFEEILEHDLTEDGTYFPVKGVMYKDKSSNKFYMLSKEIEFLGFNEESYIWKDLSTNNNIGSTLEYFQENFSEVNTKDVLK